MKLPWGQAKLCKNLLFLDFRHPKLQINMPFVCSKPVEKEQGKRTFLWWDWNEWNLQYWLTHFDQISLLAWPK